MFDLLTFYNQFILATTEGVMLYGLVMLFIICGLFTFLGDKDED